jgi:phage FluMu gp28-like protein
MVDIDKISEEYIKCYSDKSRIYMIEHYLKTYDATQRKEVPFKLFPKQKELIRTIGEGNDVVTKKSRQQGITTTSAAYFCCQMALADPEAPITILVVGNTLDLSTLFLNKCRDFLMQLPRWFFGENYWSPDPNDKKNKEKIFIVSNQKEVRLANGSKILARSSGPDATRGVGKQRCRLAA